MIAGIILAAGKGTRIKSRDRNKVTLPFLNKPLIVYSVELMLGVCDKVVVVIGAFHESVRQVLASYPVIYAYQQKRLGTAHATKIGVEVLKKTAPLPDLVLVGYGDHTMFYQQQTIKKLITTHQRYRPAVSLLTFYYPEPNRIRYGRIIRDDQGFITDIVEQKDATADQLKIKEVNPGFYCFDFNFLADNLKKVKKSPASGEYYLTDLIKIAVGQGKKVVGLTIDFGQAGLGVNTAEELKESEKIYLSKHQNLK